MGVSSRKLRWPHPKFINHINSSTRSIRAACGFIGYQLEPPEVVRRYRWPKGKGDSLVLAAHREIPYGTLEKILLAAGSAGFNDWYIRVVRRDNATLNPYVQLPRFILSTFEEAKDRSQVPGLILRLGREKLTLRADARFTNEGESGESFQEADIDYSNVAFYQELRSRIRSLKETNRVETECVLYVSATTPLSRLVDILVAIHGYSFERMFPDPYLAFPHEQSQVISAFDAH